MTSYVTSTSLPDFRLWERLNQKRVPFSFDLELTARCNNNCRHCYINLPAGDKEAQHRELSLSEIDSIASQAVELGALWCLLTGGEPLLRPDFPEIYALLKKKGLLLSVFTNACLVTPEHVRLLQALPPRDVEVTVYGVTPEVYEAVTRKPGSYRAFCQGLYRLLEGGIKVRLKAMALRSNLAELPEIAHFCRRMTKDYYRFDPLLHLRYDGNPVRNAEIRSERLSAPEIAALEQSDSERMSGLEKSCADLIQPENTHTVCDHLFHCGAGMNDFSVRSDGQFRLCSSLNRPDCLYNLRTGSLSEAWNDFVPRIRDQRSPRPEFKESCRSCPLINLCLWCPAHADLECGQMDAHSDYFCEVAHARAENVSTFKR